MRRVISVIVLNEHGVLSRISGLFAGRGYNIDSLTVAPVPDSNFSRLSIITSGDEKVLEQIVKQLHKLIPTYKVIENSKFIEKEMALVKIPLSENYAGLDAILKGYNGSVANTNENHIIVMVTDDTSRVDNFLMAIKKFNPVDIVRGGSVLMDF
ncbi:acetolactate synthase small subunit [Campylobacter pinnipediorum]|uniref:Acetolactate synthase small subunit n=1 Tax=Campylobacter pinnipediorum subsp. pinnipediorum TaxID=1660067 RepID=A0AAX0LA90_9BACT|nr:acetolactate synthase small subunit [Campylobacter pinnipediorum]AQW81222.1 acetolactate synthase III, valine-sensitive, regulatory (small) subunit [Campylobacter pinnipediorum subsp. pinnipediorum]AQW82839.1 acetolactate synthase III, valine-sensitive, regulatory (small) subunit [Campylobacter pinnipediorum subsp. pinnipediorum]AQW84526.1 acetolactate synthase III, valine-sensitive, regulatory (small) subunit [Campylobacter pinnipediorum subsp. pinnipediorum]OPA78006.1 acetolactate synthase